MPKSLSVHRNTVERKHRKEMQAQMVRAANSTKATIKNIVEKRKDALARLADR